MKYNILHAMGIDLWHLRDDFNLQTNKDKLPIFSNKYVVNAKLLAILPFYTNEEFELSIEHKESIDKIIFGMLSVLDLNENDSELMLTRINFPNKNPNKNLIEKIDMYLKNLNPMNIMYFGKKCTNCTFTNEFVVNHPLHLFINPQEKRQAYKDLLWVKKCL